MDPGMRKDSRSMSHRVALSATGTLFLLCLLTSLAGYVFTAPRPEKNPPRVLFSTAGGNVLFSHREHFHEEGAGLGCTDCHHNEAADTATLAGMDCRSCHYGNPDVVETVCADDAAHPRCIGRQCLACHDGEECTFCHRKRP